VATGLKVAVSSADWFSSSVDATFTSSVDATFTSSVDATFTSSVDAIFKSSVDATFTWMKRSFVYSADTQFDTTNTSKDSAPFDGAGSGVIFGTVSFACGGLRFDSLGVSLLFSRQGPAFQKNMIASNVARWLRSETRVWIGNKQARTFLQPQIHRKREASRERSRREGGWEREKPEENQGRFCGAGGQPYSCTW
jgi:hypothetical protein